MSHIPQYGGSARPSQPSNGSRLTNPIPKLQEPILLSRDTSMGNTPDIASDLNQQLDMHTSSGTESDSLLDYESSVDGDTMAPPVKGLPIASLPTGLCYDERMRYHAEMAAQTGESVHPEDPRRIYYIFKELCEAGLVAGMRNEVFVTQPLLRIPAREATKDECCLVHTRQHYNFVESTADMNDGELLDLSEDISMDSIYFNRLSYYSAKLSAGAAIETCRAVVSRKVKNAIAVIRPPGHHAEVQATMGFCLFNNVCIASRVCQNDFGESCRKILILDWDVHHGNGCQQAFYDDPNILYISIHVHMNGNFYPSGHGGSMEKCGRDAGLGKNVNIPWPTKGMGDGDYMYAFQHVVMPIANEFDPDFVIVAAGFDAAAGDELGGCFVTPACYAHMTHMLMSLANGKIAVCLEGGYNFSAISKSALAVTRTLMGEPPDRLMATQATQYAVETVEKVRQIQSKYWKCINPKDPVAGMYGGQRLHDVLRQYQAMTLYENHKLTQLHIFRDTVSESFNQQVLATMGYEKKKRLLVIFHDPPDLLTSDGASMTLKKPHETWMVDGTQAYIEWAVKRDFGVIDVNMPEWITINDPTIPDYHEKDVEYSTNKTDMARKEGEKLAFYLWENYIEPYDFDVIYMMGAGHSFHAVAKLISENENVSNSLHGVISFIASNPVRPIGNTTNHWVTQWYRDNSLVFVSRTHFLWKKDGKISKRYGKLIKSQAVMLNEMMKLHEEQVCDWMLHHANLEEVNETSGEEAEDEVKIEDEVLGTAVEDGAVVEETQEDHNKAVGPTVAVVDGSGTNVRPEFGFAALDARPDVGTTTGVGLNEDVVMSTEK